MISNERPSPLARQPYQPPYAAQPPRLLVPADILKTEVVVIERKSFVLTLKENPSGRFLRVVEQTSGRSNAIIIPATGLAEFKRVIDEMVKAADSIPARHGPAAA